MIDGFLGIAGDQLERHRSIQRSVGRADPVVDPGHGGARPVDRRARRVAIEQRGGGTASQRKALGYRRRMHGARATEHPLGGVDGLDRARRRELARGESRRRPSIEPSPSPVLRLGCSLCAQHVHPRTTRSRRGATRIR